MSDDSRAMLAWIRQYEPEQPPIGDAAARICRRAQLHEDPASCGPHTRLVLAMRDRRWDAALRHAEAIDAFFGLLDTWLPGEDAQ